MYVYELPTNDQIIVQYLQKFLDGINRIEIKIMVKIFTCVMS